MLTEIVNKHDPLPVLHHAYNLKPIFPTIITNNFMAHLNVNHDIYVEKQVESVQQMDYG